MNSYNAQLVKLREERNLTIKEAAKGAKVNRFMLFLFENGYFRPRGKILRRLNAFYDGSISTKGIDAYPTPVKEHTPNVHEKKSLFIKRIVFGALSLVMLVSSITGVVLFSKSVNNEDSFYGDVYNEVRSAVVEGGNLGHDLITSLEYYQTDYNIDARHANILFYKTDNLLYFNQYNFSSNLGSLDPEVGTARIHFKFGGGLSQRSSVCEFTYANMKWGTFYTCNFDYLGEEVTEYYNLVVHVKGLKEIDPDYILYLINWYMPEVHQTFNTIIETETGKNYDFVNDFLPAREQGRKVNFSLQIASLFLMGIGIFSFFIFFGIELNLLVVNIKPRLVVTKNSKAKQENKNLPKDITLKYGIPDFFISVLGITLTVGSIILTMIGLASKLGVIVLPKFFSADWFSELLKDALIAGVFLRQFVCLVRLKKPEALLKTIIFKLFLFLFIATIETAIIAVTNAWGYDFASLIYSYIPSNIFEIVAVHLIIFLFLFFQPPFLTKLPKYARYIWHGLSILPLGFLVFTYFMSNAYNLTYGVQENIYVNFWFPNGFLALSIVSVAFMYTIFGLRLFLERKYGQRNAQLFFYGDRYNLIENLVCCGFLLIVGLVDLCFMHNQVAFYLGLGHNQWIFVLIPLIFFTKYSPNKLETLVLENEIEEIARGINNEV